MILYRRIGSSSFTKKISTKSLPYIVLIWRYIVHYMHVGFLSRISFLVVKLSGNLSRAPEAMTLLDPGVEVSVTLSIVEGNG